MSEENPRVFFEQWSSRMNKAKTAAPDVARGFGTLFQSVMKEGSLSVREKELVALGIAMTMRCDSCVLAHLQKVRQLGVSREQVMETAGVAVMMQGGPAYTYLPKVVEALEALETE